MDTVYAPKTGLYFPGTASNYIRTPTSADVQLTGDQSYIWTARYSEDIVDASVQRDIWNISGGDGSRYIRVHQTSGFVFQVFPTSFVAGGILNYTFSSAEADISSTEIVRLGATLDISDGSNSVVKFWKYSDGQWNNFKTVTNTLISTLVPGAAPPTWGVQTATANAFKGLFLDWSMYDGIGDNSAPGLGTKLFELEASKTKPRSRDFSGKIWTITGSDVVTEKVYHD